MVPEAAAAAALLPSAALHPTMCPRAFFPPCRLGLEGCVEGIDAQRVEGYCMFKGEGEAVVAYPTEGALCAALLLL